MKNKFYLIKDKSANNISSKQKESSWVGVDDVYNPPISFNVLTDTHSCSSILSWIINKIAVKSNTPFLSTESEKLDLILANLDIEEIVTNLLIYGNCYLERLETLWWEKTLEFERIITENAKLSKKDNVYLITKKTNDLEEVNFTQDQVLSFKRTSVTSKKYWDSLFSKCVDEIILYSYIIKYFKKFFWNWNISPNILFDESGILDKEQIEKIEALINDRIAGIENSSSTVIIQAKMWKIDLSTIFDPEKYIKLKRELKEDIAIGMNIPFDLLSSENSNRATSQSAMEALYSNIIIPLQDRFLIQLRKQLLSWYRSEKGSTCWEWITEENILKIAFSDINLKNPKEEMETLTWYQKNWVLSVNEVREIADLGSPIDWGDEYKLINWSGWELSDSEEKEVEKIRNNIKKMYLWNKI